MAIHDLHRAKTREVAGATTNSRFRFQTNLAIVELCDLYEKSKSDFAILIEHFEDLTILEFSEDPGITFVQVKAKSSSKWTIDSLVKCDAKGLAPTSIIGKLYQNASAFPKDTKALTFVSNAPFSVKLSTGDKCSSEATEIKGTAFHSEEVTKIDAGLEADFPSPRSPECVKILSLRKTALSPTDAETYVVGRISQLVEAETGAFAPVTALYKTIFADLSAKASRVETYTTTEDLLHGKAVRRADLTHLLQNSQAFGRFEPMKDLIVDELKDSGCTTIDRARILAGCNKFMANRSRGEFAETQIGDAARKALSVNPDIIGEAGSIIAAAEALQIGLMLGGAFPDELLYSGCLVSVAERLSV